MPEASGGAPVRVWHQSITDLSSLPRYRDALARTAESVTGEGTVVDVHGVSPGTYPPGTPPIVALRSRWVEHLLSVQIVQAAVRAEAEGYDAVAVSCFFDPGLRQARSLVDIPVVSACESSLLVASTAGARCGLLALDAWHAEFLRHLVVRYGASDRVAAVVRLDPPVDEHELEAGLPQEDLLGRLERAAVAAVAAGADVVVPAEGVLSSAASSAGARQLAGAPVVDGFASVLAHAEMLVRLQRTTGLRTTRLGEHARVGAEVVARAASSAACALDDGGGRG